MIDPLTGAGLSAGLAGLNGQFAGMSMGTAYDQYITGQYETDDGPTIGFADYTSDRPSISGDTSGSISTVPDGVPVESWGDYIETNPKVTVSRTTGGAVSGSKIVTFAYSLMEEHPSTAQATVKAVATVGVPIASAITAISQAVGVSIEYAKLGAEVEQELNNALLSSGGVVFDQAKGLVTAWKDEWGRILFPKKAFDAVKNSLDELNIPLPPDYDAKRTTSSFYPNGFAFTSGPIYGYDSDGNPANGLVGGAVSTSFAGTTTAINYVTASKEPFRYEYVEVGSDGSRPVYGGNARQETIGGNTFYWMGVGTNAVGALNPAIENYNAANIAYTMLYGTITGDDYVDGTTRSEAPYYDSDTIPIAGNLATSYDPETGNLDYEPLVPINIPEDPYDATGSTIDPTSPTDDENAGVINPGIPGYVPPDTADPSAQPREENVPIPLPIPDTNASNPDVPLVDSSVIDSTLINELVEELANTLDPQAPQSSGIIPIPQLPGITDPETGDRTFPSVIPDSGAGFIHVYNPTPQEFVAFGTWLWVTYADATIDKILNNPFDGVIGAHELYATPNRGGRDNIRSAFLTCPTTADLVPNRYSEIDCGTVVVPEFYGNYLDYSPYSQAYIYLPFIGINEVSIDDIVGHAVNIRYRVDSYSGSCIAMIFVAKGNYQNLCYQFAGNCAVEVPMAGGSQAAIKAAEMQAEAYARAAMVSAGGHLLGGIGSALMGSLGGAISSIGGIAGDYANAKAGVEAARVANKSSVQHSGQFGASHGAMGEKIPFIIIRNPIQVKVVNYNDDYGFPAHKRVIVGGCTGYLRVREVNVISAHATDDEKAAIEALLKNGVYVS